VKYLLLGVYRPVSNGKVVPGITAVGTIGVWRLLCSDYSTTQEDALTQMSENAWNIQPEKENFILAELIIGAYALSSPCQTILICPSQVTLCTSQ